MEPSPVLEILVVDDWLSRENSEEYKYFPLMYAMSKLDNRWPSNDPRTVFANCGNLTIHNAQTVDGALEVLTRCTTDILFLDGGFDAVLEALEADEKICNLKYLCPMSRDYKSNHSMREWAERHGVKLFDHVVARSLGIPVFEEL